MKFKPASARRRRQVAFQAVEAMEGRTLLSGYTSVNTVAALDSSIGDLPTSGVVVDAAGDLFGTTTAGGASGYGTLYEIAAHSSTPQTIYSFDPSYRGTAAGSLTVDGNGDVFGTTGGSTPLVYELSAGSSDPYFRALLPTGSTPVGAPAVDGGGNLFGVSGTGGTYGLGFVYELPVNASSTTLVASLQPTTGRMPLGGVTLDSHRNLYGTTSVGGAYNDGTIYKITTGGTTVAVVASFNSATGYTADSKLTADSSGNLFGVTHDGGANSYGTVFEYAAATSTLTPVVSFNGGYATSGLTIDGSGNLFGAMNGSTPVYELPKGGSAILDIGSLGYLNGVVGEPVMDSLGNLFAVAEYGRFGNSVGEVFELSGVDQMVFTQQPTAVTAGTAETPIAVAIQNPVGGVIPGNTSVVTLMQTGYGDFNTTNGLRSTVSTTAVNGVATFTGVMPVTAGTTSLTASAPSLPNITSASFNVSPGSPAQIGFQYIYDTNAGQPIRAYSSVVVQVEDAYDNVTPATDTITVGLASTSTAGNLSGTTTVAAVNGIASFSNLTLTRAASGYILQATDTTRTSLGTTISNAFTIRPAVYQLTTIADATAAVGKYPGGAVADSSGNLYAVSSDGNYGPGGPNGYGSVYKVNASTGAMTILAPLTAATGYGTWNQTPLRDPSGNLFFMTWFNPVSATGYLYELPAGSGTLTRIAQLPILPGIGIGQGSLVRDSAGDLFGSVQAEDGGLGQVFELPAGQTTLRTVAQFNASGSGLPAPRAMAIDPSGNLYGVCYGGGIYDAGAVVKIPAGTSTVQTLHTFTGDDGQYPDAVALDSAGNLFGVTNYNGGSYTFGTVFEIPAGTTTLNTLARMNVYSLGSNPAAVAVGPGDVVYFGTSTGVFEVTPGSPAIEKLYDFTGYDGQYVQNLSLASNGSLSGATNLGGNHSSSNIYDGAGSVFTITPATHLAVTRQPGNGNTSAPLTVSVAVEDPYNNIAAGDQSAVTVSIRNGPSGGTLAGTPTVTVVNGVATFGNLTFTKPGTYTLNAADGTMATITSSSFTVVTPTAVSLTGAAFYLRLATDGLTLDVYNNSTGTGTPTTYALANVYPLTLTGTAGNDSLTLDYTNGPPIPAGGGFGYNGLGGVNTATVIGTAGNDSFTVNSSNVSVGISTATLTNVQTVIVSPAGGVDAITLGAGATASLPTAAPGGGIVARNFSSIALGAGSKLIVPTAAARADRTLLVIQSSTFASGATIDLGGNDADFQNTTAAAVTALLRSGLTSSTAAADASHTTGLGMTPQLYNGTDVFSAAKPFDGIVPGYADVLVKYTYIGDANLDGKVDGSDYSRIDFAGRYPQYYTGWSNGDFNFDGVIDGSDYTLIDNAFNRQRTALPPALIARPAAVADGIDWRKKKHRPAGLFAS